MGQGVHFFQAWWPWGLALVVIFSLSIKLFLMSKRLRALKGRPSLEDFSLLMKSSHEHSEKAFRALAHELFDEKSQRLKRESQESLEALLGPLKSDIERFQRDFTDKVLRQDEKKIELREEIRNLRELNVKLSDQAEDLTKALLGNVKVQGNWGEVILERILESSGLQEGRDYIKQGKGLGIKGADGQIQRPDVIVTLPGHRHLIIDSKVTLAPYISAIKTQEKKDVDQFLKAIKEHIKGLSSKKYDSLDSLCSPDFVIMFIPIEGAYMLVQEKDSHLLDFSWGKGVILVGPTNLLAIMKTVCHLWRQEKQTKNALEIAQQGGRLHDSLVALVEEFQSLGGFLEKSQKSYDHILQKIQSGRGNLVQRAQKLRELGARASKDFPLDC